MKSLLTNRRRVLKGMLGSSAITVALPLLDCFLNENGLAFANGAPLPKAFGTWVWGLGLPLGQWEPQNGEHFTQRELLKSLASHKEKINLYSGMRVFLDGKPSQAHFTGKVACLSGCVPAPEDRDFATTLDTDVADVIGARSRFRSLEVNCYGSSRSNSRRSGGAANSAEPSPIALYRRIFGPEFKDPNATEFKPDALALARASALSAVKDQRDAMMRSVGAADRVRLDQYFTSVRTLEQQVEVELTKPAPIESCSIPEAPAEQPTGTEIKTAIRNHELLVRLLAHAVACDQTRVINVDFGGQDFRREGEAKTFHAYTHEEYVNEAGIQPVSFRFAQQAMESLSTMLTVFDSVQEGPNTLLDRMLMYCITDVCDPKTHTTDNIPIFTAGRAGGAVKSGMHVYLSGDPVARLGLTVQQVMGVPLSEWGKESNRTTQTINDILA